MFVKLYEAVYEELRRSPGRRFTQEEIATATGTDAKRAQATLSKLYASHEIRREKAGAASTEGRYVYFHDGRKSCQPELKAGARITGRRVNGKTVGQKELPLASAPAAPAHHDGLNTPTEATALARFYAPLLSILSQEMVPERVRIHVCREFIREAVAIVEQAERKGKKDE